MKKLSLGTIFKSFRAQIFLVVMLVGIIPAGLCAIIFPALYVQRTVENDVSNLTASGQVLINRVLATGYLSDTSSDVVNSEINAFSNLYSGRVMIINESLIVVKDSYSVDEGKTMVWSNIVTALEGTNTSYYNEENEYLAVAIPIVSTGGEQDETQGVLLITKSMSYLTSTAEFFTSISSITMVVLVILILVAALHSSHRFAMPYKKFETALNDEINGLANEIAVNDFPETSVVSEKLNEVIAQMRLVDESRQEFVSNVSHELKTPLTSMKVLADSLNGMGDAPVELYKEFMVDITDEIDRETKIINDLLSLVKLDKAQMTIDAAPLNINELIELVLKRIRPIAEKANVEIVYESFRPVIAEVDEVKLTLAISNLVENGVKYNHEGGWVRVSLNADHQYFYIKVEDSGMGIPQESLDLVFERFYRVDKSHSREIGGTGLGLAITKNAITMHRGEIKVHSTEGEGTTFDVRIPLNYVKQ